MITYELAKELWDAGFPERPRHRAAISRLIDETRAVDAGQPERQLPEVYLDELIRECGTEFASLYVTNDGYWRATQRSTSNYSEGMTPEEAVARFWLALHKPL
jgi:hypothetical protein